MKKERLLHHVTVSVFCKPHDDRAAVLRGLDEIAPVPSDVLLAQEPEHDPERPHTIHYRMPDTVLTVQDVATDEGKMTIFTLFFRKMHDVNLFAKALRNAMTPDEVAQFAEDPALLLDADMRLSCRLDKELLMAGRWSLTDDGNCYQVRASIAAYPKTEEVTITALARILGKSL